MIEITDMAIYKIKNILKQNPGKHLRLSVEGDGCAGPYLKLSLDEANLNEKTIQVKGIDILISDDIQRYAEITTINIFVNDVEKDLL